MPSPADRNLLFGVLAWQNSLVTEHEILEAFKVWTSEKSRSLGDILVEHNVLSSEQLIALAPMVEANLQLHGDAESALQHLGSSVDILATIQSHITDEDINESIDQSTYLSGSLTRDPNSKDTHSKGHANWRVPQSGARFKILRPHAKGGLGEVFVARDGELNRDVAVKEIQSRYCDHADSRDRFLLEAEVTGGLEHPGIVPVYGLGQYPDGRPYYAMRFIKGDSLKDAIRTFYADQSLNDTLRSLNLRKLLGRFIDVCQSIGYAHSRGVLHRDLKPGNIMLGKYGETLVVDWGLARVIGRGESKPSSAGESALSPSSGSNATPTVMGSAIGTPGYMPPEQAAGRIDELGPSSDVYSLGATLYHVVTGQAPFQGPDVATVLQDVQQGNFEPPRSVRSAVPRALDAICTKAMSLRPEDRYATPQDLAEDVERFLADEKTQAYRESMVTRAMRWMRKHQTWTTTTVASVLISVLGLSVFSTVVSRKNTQLSELNTSLDGKNQALDAKNSELLAANTREQQARSLAEKNEAAAKTQADLTLSTLTSVVNDINYGLEGIPGGSTIRRRLLETSMQKLQIVATEYIGQASLDFNTMEALMEMGDLIVEVGQDELSTTLSRNGEAREESVSVVAASFYKKALSIAQKLHQDYPEEQSVYAALAQAQMRSGEMKSATGNLLGAIEDFHAAFAIVEELRETDPDSASYRANLVDLHNHKGRTHAKMGKWDEAMSEYTQGFEVVEQHVASNPGEGYWTRALIISHDNLAGTLTAIGNMPEARGHYEAMMRLGQEHSRVQPDDTIIRSYVAYGNQQLGWMYFNEGDKQNSLKHFAESMRLTDQLVSESPNNLIYKSWKASIYGGQGSISSEAGEHEDALELYQKRHKILTELSQLDSENTVYASEIASSHMQLADAQWQLNQRDQTRENLSEVSKIYQQLTADAPQNVDWQRGLATALEREAMLLEADEKWEQALGLYREMYKIKKQLADKSPNHALAQRELSITHRHLGDMNIKLRDPEGAVAQYQKSVDIAKPLVDQDANDAQARDQLTNCYFNVAETYVVLGKFKEAEKNYELACDVRRDMIAKNMAKERSTEMLQFLTSCVKRARKAPQALADWDTFFANPPEKHQALLELRGMILTQQQLIPEMLDTAEKFLQLDKKSTRNPYNAACMYSLAAEFVSKANPTLSDEQKAECKDYADRATAAMKVAIKNGFDDELHMLKDSDLAYLASTPGWQELLELLDVLPSAGVSPN